MLLDPLCAINTASNINHKEEAFVENGTKSMRLNSLEILQE